MKRTVIGIVVALVTVLTLFAVGVVAYLTMMGPGSKTATLDSTDAEPASTDMNGHWNIIDRAGQNTSSAGYTFHELLPNEARDTSGTTEDVDGQITVEDDKIVSGDVTVNMDTVSSDNKKRDNSVRDRIFFTYKYPESKFRITGPVDVSSLPDDGTVGTVKLTGDLTIFSTTREVSGEVRALRTGNRVIVGGDIPINRKDFGVEAPELVAAKIDEEGELNLLLVFEKQ